MRLASVVVEEDARASVNRITSYNVCYTKLLRLVVDERLEELERPLLGQAALVKLELGADHDDRKNFV